MMLITIPDLFHSTDTNQPFTHCISCNRELLTGDFPYIVEKAIRRYPEYHADDVIFEYAMCIECYEEIQNMFSADSRRNIQEYFLENVNMEERRHHLFSHAERSYHEWLKHCVVKNTPVSEMHEYQIIGEFRGPQLQLGDLPLVIGLEAMDEIAELLSNQTLDEMNRFYGRFLGLPPELRDIFDDRRVFII